MSPIDCIGFYCFLHGIQNIINQSCFPCLPCFHHSHLVFTYILASVPFLKALFVSFTFLVWIILKYEIHLGNILYIHVEG
uniref:Uncharacterized protein n=1 Tax=Buteo japonicus TaxID=224669 RepID=A0A8C0BG71_9AVES